MEKNLRKSKKNLLTARTLGDIDSEHDAGWSSLVARRAHNPKVIGSNPFPATSKIKSLR